MFNLFAPRSPEDGTDETLYPAVAVQPAEHLVQLNAADGTDIKGFMATGMQVQHDGHRVLNLENSQIEVLVTDSRVTVAIKDWIQPGRSYGIGLGAISASVSNAAQAGRARRMMDGRIAVAQFTYNWIAAIAARPRRYRKPEFISFQFVQADGKANTWAFLMLDKQTDLFRIQDTVVRRTALWKAANYRGGINEDDLAQLTAIAANPSSFRQVENGNRVAMPGLKRLPPTT